MLSIQFCMYIIDSVASRLLTDINPSLSCLCCSAAFVRSAERQQGHFIPETIKDLANAAGRKVRSTYVGW